MWSSIKQSVLNTRQARETEGSEDCSKHARATAVPRSPVAQRPPPFYTHTGTHFQASLLARRTGLNKAMEIHNRMTLNGWLPKRVTSKNQ